MVLRLRCDLSCTFLLPVVRNLLNSLEFFQEIVFELLGLYLKFLELFPKQE